MKTKTELMPMHLSMMCNDLDVARRFYGDLLGLEERRSTKTSVHFDWFGSQLTIHNVAGYNARHLHREVDAEDVPVPHFGAALDERRFHEVARHLGDVQWKFVLEPHKRFVGKHHEQWVMFVLDPSGNAIELKSFTQVSKGEWA